MKNKKNLFGALAISVIIIVLIGYYLNSTVSIPYEENESYVEEISKIVTENRTEERRLTYSNSIAKAELDGTIIVEENIINTDHTAGWFTLWGSTTTCGLMSDQIYLNPGEQGKIIVNSRNFVAAGRYCSAIEFGITSELKTVTDEHNVTVYENVTKYRIVTKYKDAKRYEMLFG